MTKKQLAKLSIDELLLAEWATERMAGESSYVSKRKDTVLRLLEEKAGK